MRKFLNRGISTTLGLIIIVAVAALATGGIFAYQKLWAPKENQRQATQNTQNETVNWKTYTNTEYGFAIKYPDNFLSQEITVKSFSFNLDSCPHIDRSGVVVDKTGQENNIRQGFVAQMDKTTINNQTFCYKEMGDPAAGTVYYSDYYATAKDQKGFVMVLSTAAPNCQNYLPLEQGNAWQKQSYDNCLTANDQRPKTIEKIISTFKFIK